MFWKACWFVLQTDRRQIMIDREAEERLSVGMVSSMSCYPVHTKAAVLL